MRPALTTARGLVYDVNVTLNSRSPPTIPPTPPFVAQQPIKIYQCPSDPTLTGDGTQTVAGNYTPASIHHGADQSYVYGSCSYACNYLVFGNIDAAKNIFSADNPDGFDLHGSPGGVPGKTAVIPVSFPDGTSNTLLFAEKYSSCQWFEGHESATPFPGWQSVVGRGPAFAAGDGRLRSAPIRRQYRAVAPAFAMETPWNNGTTFQMSPTASECDVAYPQTAHTGGMVVGLADASVRLSGADDLRAHMVRDLYPQRRRSGRRGILRPSARCSRGPNIPRRYLLRTSTGRRVARDLPARRIRVGRPSARLHHPCLNENGFQAGDVCRLEGTEHASLGGPSSPAFLVRIHPQACQNHYGNGVLQMPLVIEGKLRPEQPIRRQGNNTRQAHIAASDVIPHYAFPLVLERKLLEIDVQRLGGTIEATAIMCAFQENDGTEFSHRVEWARSAISAWP